MWDDLGFERQITKVMASSDLKGLWLWGDRAGRTARPERPEDRPAIKTLVPDFIGDNMIGAILDDLAAYEAHIGAEPWAQHYSSYNKRQSWTAFALRGYIPEDPSFIIKPAEMSKKWKAEHPELTHAKCDDTIARDHFPSVDHVLDRLPGQAQRLRLMRLAGGGGELSRHADITDPEAGTADNCTARLHIPLKTPEACRFIGWDIDGNRAEQHLGVGSLAYLDTRKPHSVINPADQDRVHLVIDCLSTRELRAMIAA